MSRLRNIFACLCPALFLAASQARAQTPVWADNFETNAASRWQSSGVWKIGSPTAGPALNAAGHRAHSGTNCASTQSYAYNMDTRLVCIRYNGASSLLVPAADQLPRLRFWHWFHFANALGYVEISTNLGESWTQISPTYPENLSAGVDLNGGGVWSRPYIDLSLYAGQHVQIAFHFTSGGCCGNALGWFVDDVEVDTGTPVLNFPEGFEFNPNTSDWFEDFGTWEIGHPTSGPDAAHTGTNCAATVLAGNYTNNVDSRLISPPFVVPASGNATLNYWQWYSFVNALGFVEVNNGITTITSTTNTIITTNTAATSLNTNIYQLFGAADPGYTTPFYWNPTIGGWTNNLGKALGNVYDLVLPEYNFVAGNEPLAPVYQAVYDYIADIAPAPESASPTNFIAWQGMTWNSRTDGSDNPVGYFGTNSSSYTYTTNTTVTVSQTSWTQVSPTYTDASAKSWASVSLDLSAFAGQAVQVAFHFTSGGTGTAPGWYVDDLSLAAAPELIVPTNQFIIAYGQKFTNSLAATNPIEPASLFTFALAAATTNVVVKTNGLVTWTGTNTPPGTYVVFVKVTDNNTPPFSVTNNFSVTVLPLPSQLNLTNALLVGHNFKFSIKTPWTNYTWWIVATTNLETSASNWVPVYTNLTGHAGTVLFTDRLATNFLQRYYRAVFP
jgi:hypothetical protein